MHTPRLKTHSLTLLGVLCALVFIRPAWASPEVPDAGLFPDETLSSLPSAVPPPSEVPGECGLEEAAVPDFLLRDLNPSSSTYQQDYTLDVFQSEVLVIYWALAS
jgi:hypothetical protein